MPTESEKRLAYVALDGAAEALGDGDVDLARERATQAVDILAEDGDDDGE